MVTHSQVFYTKNINSYFMALNQYVRICKLNKLRIAMALCFRCNGSKKYMGNGMMLADCKLCDDDFDSISRHEKSPKIDRKSKSYQNALKDIMALNPTITKQEAVKMFDKAYDKA